MIGVAACTAIVALPIIALRAARKVTFDPVWVAVSVALLVLYLVALALGHTIPIGTMNWSGKLLAVLLWMVVLWSFVAFKKDFSRADAGLILNQKPGSIPPALIAVALFLLLQILLMALGITGRAGGDVEGLLFQALMPGLDEEPMFRGLLLYTLSLGIASGRLNVFGAPLNVAGTTLAILFGLLHGLAFDGTNWHFSGTYVAFAGSYGLILLWLRERTGSVVIPIVAHNAVNFVGQFGFI